MRKMTCIFKTIYFLFSGKDRVIFVTEEDQDGPSKVSLPEDDEQPGKLYLACRIIIINTNINT